MTASKEAPDLGPAIVDVRWARTDEMRDPLARAATEALLDPNDQSRLSRYLRDENKWELLLGRRLARAGLSQRARTLGVEVEVAAWGFERDSHGCPRVVAPARFAHLRFNISHGGGMAVCAVSEGVDVGVDIEPVDRVCEVLEVGRRFFSKREAEDLGRLPTVHQQARFLEYWTLKEAYIKGRGLGLAIPLGGFSFVLGSDQVPTDAPARVADRQPIGIEFAPSVVDNPARWHFFQYHLGATHVMALAVASGPALPVVSIEPG